VRRAKDNHDVPNRYYRPERMQCARCRQYLKRCYPLWRKYVVFLEGRYLVVSMGYSCQNPKCTQYGRVYASQAAQRLTLRGSSFALEVTVQIGYWRFWRRWTVTQIHEALTQERGLPISEREVLYLSGVFLVLLRCTHHLRLEEHAADFRYHGLFLALDALKPEKGNAALYVVRELQFGLVLHVRSLLSADHKTLERQLLQSVKDLGYRIRGVVSDDEKALVIAVARTFPRVPHQTCQIHCLRDAARPLAEADRAFKKALKKAIRRPFYAACRALKEQGAPTDPCAQVLNTSADLMRSTLTEGSKPPFALGGLRVFEDLARLEASLQRSRQKGAIRSWINWRRWLHSADHLRHNIGNSNANEAGWGNWSVDSIRRRLRGNRAQPVSRSSAKSKSFSPNWNSTRQTVPTMRVWSRTSVQPSVNAGRGSSGVMPGPNVTGPTMTWKPSLVGCGPDNVKFKAASLSMSLSSGMVNGQSLSTQPNPMSKCCIASSNSSRRSLIMSTRGFYERNNGSAFCIVFAIGLATA
jgi:Transposase, Mutator family